MSYSMKTFITKSKETIIQTEEGDDETGGDQLGTVPNTDAGYCDDDNFGFSFTDDHL